jgi:hypothetical protein
MRQADKGDVDAALATVRLGYELADKVAREPTFVSALVSLAQLRMVNDALVAVMNHPKSPNLYWALALVPGRAGVLRTAYDGEEVLLVGSIPALARVRAGESLSAAQWRKVLTDDVEPFFQTMENYRKVIKIKHPHAIGDAGADALRRAREDYAVRHDLPAEDARAVDAAVVLGEFYFAEYQKAVDDATKTRSLPYPVMIERLNALAPTLKRLREEQAANPFLGAVDEFRRGVWGFARTDRQLAALTAVEAIRSYAAANGGKLPARLEDVVETPVPLNPVTAKPFEYKLDGNVATIADTRSAAYPMSYTVRIRP